MRHPAWRPAFVCASARSKRARERKYFSIWGPGGGGPGGTRAGHSSGLARRISPQRSPPLTARPALRLPVADPRLRHRAFRMTGPSGSGAGSCGNARWLRASQRRAQKRACLGRFGTGQGGRGGEARGTAVSGVRNEPVTPHAQCHQPESRKGERGRRESTREKSCESPRRPRRDSVLGIYRGDGGAFLGCIYCLHNVLAT